MSIAERRTRTEVPTFAQITIGATRATSERPAVTTLIEMKVIALLLWVSAPESRPSKAAATGLRVARSIRRRNHGPESCLRWLAMSLTPTKNSPRPASMSMKISIPSPGGPDQAGRFLRIAVNAARARTTMPTPREA